MVVVPFPSSRFTSLDVAMIVEFCYGLMRLRRAGGWARHSTNDGGDVIRVLNPEDDFAKYTFDRSKSGSYRIFDASGALLVDGGALDLLIHSLPEHATSQSAWGQPRHKPQTSG